MEDLVFEYWYGVASACRGTEPNPPPAIITEGGVMPEPPKGCGRVTGTVAGGQPEGPQPAEADEARKEAVVTARVGQKAPDFTAPAYYRGSFTSVQLSSFANKWVLLCFYPGDFTFV
jgi:hypothetical protein